MKLFFQLSVGKELQLFYLSHAPAIIVVVDHFTVFSYDAVLGRDSNLSPSRQRTDALRVTPQARVLIFR